MALRTLSVFTEIVAPYGRKASTPVTTRIPRALLERVELAAKRRRTSVAGLVRLSLASFAQGGSAKDPSNVLAELCDALDLPPDSAPSAIMAAVSALLATLPPEPADGAQESADPVPPAPGTFVASKSLLKSLAARGISGAELANAMRPLPGAPGSKRSTAPAKRSLTELRADRELAAKLAAKGMTLEQFELAKQRIVKTTR